MPCSYTHRAIKFSSYNSTCIMKLGDIQFGNMLYRFMMITCQFLQGLPRSFEQPRMSQWASCQIRKIAGCACAGNAGEVFSATDLKEAASWRSRHASRHVRDARVVMHVGITNLQWRGKRSRHSQRMRNQQFYVSGKRPIVTYLYWSAAEYWTEFLSSVWHPVINWTNADISYIWLLVNIFF